MKNKIILFIVLILLLSGCSNKNNEIEVSKKKNEEESVERKEIIKESEYIDLNNTPISIYELKGNTLTKLNTINKSLNIEEDIGIFQIFPSNEDIVYLNNSFANTFYEEWLKYNLNNNLKIGFNIKFSTKSGETISYNIFNPETAFDKWEYLMNYLYDDYANRDKGFYSHIEQEEYNDNSLFTAIKLQSSYSCFEINSKIQLTVFTYDTEDDFLNNEYRGNSKYTVNICINGYER